MPIPAIPHRLLAVGAALALGGTPALAQPSPESFAAPLDDAWTDQSAYGDQANTGAPLIPPNVEDPALRATDGSYCYVGPHPVDTRVAPGDSWDDTQGQHLRPYPPIDNRLFALREGCYYFTGDPRDFGYAGRTYAYYGAHPILDTYGGGWCFMMGAHTHIWGPWSPYFTVVGGWNYWYGPFDPFFWAYWPYYSFYFRSYYPGYYGGGRFYQGGGFRAAPPIRSVPAQAWRGAGASGAPVYRGTPPAFTHPSAPAAIRAGAPALRTVEPTLRPSFAPASPRGGFRGGFGGGFRRR